MSAIDRLGSKLTEELAGADELCIAVALMSDSGLDKILDAKPEDCTMRVVVGVDLPTAPDVLRRLRELRDSGVDAKVHLDEKLFFHPKLYLISKKGRTHAFIGSGNCTSGGLSTNLELSVAITEPQDAAELLAWVNRLFEKQAKDISPVWLADYEQRWKRQSERRKLDEAERFAFKAQWGARPKPKGLNELDLSGQFFQFEHFNAFTGRKPLEGTQAAINERGRVSDRLVELHKILWPEIGQRRWDIHPHYESQHITSSIAHSNWTDTKLNAIWLHYGRSKEEIKGFQAFYEYKDPNASRRKPSEQTSLFHPRLQVLVHADRVSVWFRFGKPGGSLVDRDMFCRKMKDDLAYRNSFFSSLKKLPEYFIIEVAGQTRAVSSFVDASDLHAFTALDHVQNHYFIIGTHYAPDDKRLSKERIVATVMDDFAVLEPLYRQTRTLAP